MRHRQRKVERGDVVAVTNGAYSLVWPEGGVKRTPIYGNSLLFKGRGPWTVVRKVLDLPASPGPTGNPHNDTVIENKTGAVAYVREECLQPVSVFAQEEGIPKKKEKIWIIDPTILSPGTLILFHHELWMWCSDNPEKYKEDWPRLIKNGGDVRLGSPHCFACITQYRKTGIGCVPIAPHRCGHCLVDFPKDKGECLGGLYQRWVNLGGESTSAEIFHAYRDRMAERSEVARTIARLPMKAQEKKEPSAEEEVAEEIKKSVRDFITNKYSRAVAEETDEWRKIQGDWPDAKPPRRNATPWSDGEDDLLVREFYTMTKALALTHQRNPGVVRGRLHKLLREHRI